MYGVLFFGFFFFFFQAEDGIRDAQESRGLGDVYKRQVSTQSTGDHDDAAMDQGTKETLKRIPLCKVNAGPMDDPADWTARLKEEIAALIAYVNLCTEVDNKWFHLEPSEDGLRWWGKVWIYHEMLKYEFDIEFDIPVTYPATSPELALPELDGTTAKMYRGGKICLTDHFNPLWARNVPKFGLAHAMCLGMAPWLAAEVPCLIEAGKVKPVGEK
eukprot:TRINITY_DN5191_c0_g2_i1.p1 TRINITY_DN5191_c0_g2~~TRINITY_DN5191_c0_g2_i1.p1  ORF type:complete len:215 (+),score=64.09 TRINITY_DN5191_c0_g2_i1:96-740(+)